MGVSRYLEIEYKYKLINFDDIPNSLDDLNKKELELTKSTSKLGGAKSESVPEGHVKVNFEFGKHMLEYISEDTK